MWIINSLLYVIFKQKCQQVIDFSFSYVIVSLYLCFWGITSLLKHHTGHSFHYLLTYYKLYPYKSTRCCSTSRPLSSLLLCCSLNLVDQKQWTSELTGSCYFLWFIVAVVEEKRIKTVSNKVQLYPRAHPSYSLSFISSYTFIPQGEY